MKKFRGLVGIILSFVLAFGGVIPYVATPGAIVAEAAEAIVHEVALDVKENGATVTITRYDDENRKVFSDIVKENLPLNAVVHLNLSEDDSAGYKIKSIRFNGGEERLLTSLSATTPTVLDAYDGAVLEVIYTATTDENDSFPVTFYDYDYSNETGGGMNDARNYGNQGDPDGYQYRLGVGISGDAYHTSDEQETGVAGVGTVKFGSNLGGYNYPLMMTVTKFYDADEDGVKDTYVTQDNVNANTNNGVYGVRDYDEWGNAILGYGINNGVEDVGWPVVPGLIEYLEKDANGDWVPHWGKDQNGQQIYDPGFFTRTYSMGKTIYTEDSAGLNGVCQLNFAREGYHYTLTGATVGDLTTPARVWDGTEWISNPRFFPLDEAPGVSTDQMFKDPWLGHDVSLEDVDEHNWYFGIRHEFTFKLGEYEGDLDYTFEGDDDLWVFLDGKLVLDMGGVHCVYPNDYDSGDPKKRGEDSWLNYVNLWNFIDKTDPDYKTTEHTVTILYMERGGYDSNCYMEFTLPVNQPEDFDASIDIPVDVKWVGLPDATEDGNMPAASPKPIVYLVDADNSEKLKNYTLAGNSVATHEIEVQEAMQDFVFEHASLDDGVTNYTVRVTKYPDFDIDITGNMSEGFHIVYTYNPEKISLDVKKQWDPVAPAGVSEVTVRVKRDDMAEIYRTITLNAGNDWQVTLTDLPKRKGGAEVVYSLDEVTVNGSTPTVVGGKVVDDAENDQYHYSYTITNAVQYKVNYVFKKLYATDPEIDDDVLKYLPTDSNVYYTGSPVTPIYPTSLTADSTNDARPGSWTFVYYKNGETQLLGSDTVTVGNEDVTLVGYWYFTDKYIVDYEYQIDAATQAAYPAETLPIGVTSQTPDKKIVNKGASIAPAEYAQPKLGELKVPSNDGNGWWTFNNDYVADKSTQPVETNVHIVGTWKYEPKKMYDVIYRFESVDANELPDAAAVLVNNKLDNIVDTRPADETETRMEGTDVWPSDSFAKLYEYNTLEFDSDTSKWHYWEFVGWKTTDGYKDHYENITGDVTFVGLWKRGEYPVIDINYTFEKDPACPAGTPATLPPQIEGMVPATQHMLKDEGTPPTTYVEPAYPTSEPVPDPDGLGKWTFQKYTYYTVDTHESGDYVNGTTSIAATQGVNFTGYWLYTPYYGVTYQFKSDQETLDNYNGLDVNTDPDTKIVDEWLPKDTTTYKEDTLYFAQTLPADHKKRTDVTTTEGYKGNWVFVDWESPGLRISSDESQNVLVGLWRFEERAKVQVTYTYVSSDPDNYPLPPELAGRSPEGRRPADEQVYLGDEYTVKNPTDATNYVITGTSDDGYWKWLGNDKNGDITVNAETTITGTWEFVPDPKNVTYKFVDTNGNVITDEKVEEKRPTLPILVEKDDPVNVYTAPTSPDTAPTIGTEVLAKDGSGYWRLKEYDLETKYAHTDIEFVGTWEYIRLYPVTYEFRSDSTIIGKESVPVDVEKYRPDYTTAMPSVRKNSTVTSITPAKKDIPVSDGRWVFEGYRVDGVLGALADPATVEDVTAPVHFIGYWNFIAKPTYPITYEFVCAPNDAGYTEDDFPTTITSQLPTGLSPVQQGEDVTALPVANQTIDTPQGIWTFKGYAPPEVKNVNGAVTFVGTWAIQPKYTATHTFVSGTDGKDLPTAIQALEPADITGILEGDNVYATEVAPDISNPLTYDTDGQLIYVVDSDTYWVFDGYDKTYVEKVKGDVEFVGTWRLVEKPSVTMEHVFKSDDGTELPDKVKNLKPRNTAVKVGETATPTDFNPKTVTISVAAGEGAQDGTWTFEDPTISDLGWDKTSEVARAGEKITFTGTWHFTPCYNIPYDFEKADPTEPEDLPPEVWLLLPDPEERVDEGVTVKHADNPGDIPVGTPVETDKGIWTFEGWDHEKLTAGDEPNQKFIGKWSYVPKYDIPYEFVKEDSTAPDMPTNVRKHKPLTEEGLLKGTTVTAKTITSDPIDDPDTGGQWTFLGWDGDGVNHDQKIVDKEVKFIGTWRYTERYSVIHDFVSDTPNKPTLPDEVWELLPGQKEELNGTTVSAVTPDEVRVDVPGGCWIFDGYDDPTSVTIDGGNVTFTGRWHYVEDPVDVTFEYVSVTLNKTLPDSIKNTAPDDETVTRGTMISEDDPDNYLVQVADGYWSFVEYDKNNIKANTNLQIQGRWRFVGNSPQVVRYHYESSSTEPLPPEITALEPKDEAYSQGTTVSVQKLEDEDRIVKLNGGVWVFEKFDKDSVTIDNTDELFTGTWKFVSGNPHIVNYEFVSGTSGVSVPAEVQEWTPSVNAYPDGTYVPADEPEYITYETTDGTWTFDTYNRDYVERLKGDFTFVGTWNYTPKAVYQVKYTFTSGTPNKELPGAVLALIPDSNGRLANGQTITPAQLAQMSVETADGVWKFVKWDKAGATVNGSDVSFSGEWVFEPNNNNTKAGETSSEPANRNTDQSQAPKTGQRRLP